MSSFTGLNTALSGLVAQRHGLDVTGQNIANAATPGYSRQRVVMEPVNPSATPSLHSAYDGVGTGVDVVDVERVADAFVDARARAEHETAARYGVAAEVWSRVDLLLGEPGDEGLSAQLTQFFGAWGDVANRPDSDAARVAVVQSGAAAADRLSRLGEDVAVQWTQRLDSLKGLVVDVNSTSAAVADLNRAIQQGTVAGLEVNELTDRRDVLVDRLVELTGGTVRDAGEGMVDVHVGGIAAVRGVASERLALSGASATSLAAVRAGGTVGFTWPGGIPARVPGGELGGTVEALTVTLPGVATRLDAVAADLATQVNTLHLGGKGLDGVTNRAFFSGTTTATLAVAVTSQQVAAADHDPGDPAGAPLDNSVADAIAALGEARTGPPSTWRSAVADLGASAQAARRRDDLQTVAVRESDAARQSVSGVDTDEELTRMIQFQRAYEAAARMMTAVDQALDTLINRTGLVGR